MTRRKNPTHLHFLLLICLRAAAEQWGRYRPDRYSVLQGQWKPGGIAPFSHSAAIFRFVPHQKNLLLLLFSLEGTRDLYPAELDE